MNHTIQTAISDVLRQNGGPMTPEEIYGTIIEQSLYRFKAKNPLQIVKAQLRRHCKECDLATAPSLKYFTLRPDGRFELLNEPLHVVRASNPPAREVT